VGGPNKRDEKKGEKGQGPNKSKKWVTKPIEKKNGTTRKKNEA